MRRSILVESIDNVVHSLHLSSFITMAPLHDTSFLTQLSGVCAQLYLLKALLSLSELFTSCQQRSIHRAFFPFDTSFATRTDLPARRTIGIEVLYITIERAQIVRQTLQDITTCTILYTLL